MKALGWVVSGWWPRMAPLRAQANAAKLRCYGKLGNSHDPGASGEESGESDGVR
jgi:hypothetical protein